MMSTPPHATRSTIPASYSTYDTKEETENRDVRDVDVREVESLIDS
jgi:hypothetical protein